METKALTLLTLLLLSVFSFLSPSIVGNAMTPPPTEWSKTYGGANLDLARPMIQTSDGGYAVTSGTYSYGVGGPDLWMNRVTSEHALDWIHYHNYSEIVSTLLFLNITYPSIVDVFSIGKSWLNQDIYCIRLTNESDTRPKPKVLFIGYHHARERISAELTLYFIVDMATNYGTNETITRMLNCSEIYVIPALNVDGFNAVQQNEWQRKNAHPIDEDGDGFFDEDPPMDTNGDGSVSHLYFWNGTYYRDIGYEGTDTDADGNLDWIGGVDLNRNYGYEWNATCYSGSPYASAEDYRGPAPFSEPETQAIRDLALSNDFRYAISLHSGSESIGYPWGYTTDPPPDEAIFNNIGASLSALTRAPYGKNSDMYTMSGSWDDWMYANRSTFALTCEIYANNSAWQYKPGPEPDTWWERGVFQFFNPDPSQIEPVIKRWLPVFAYITDRAITGEHDIAVTSVTTPKDGCLPKPVVFQNYTTRVDATILNLGIHPENVTIIAYANSTIIGTQAVNNLNATMRITLTFSWNTTGFNKGNYTIRAHAVPVQNEINTEDNNSTDPWIISVGMIGDINVDGQVDVQDVYAVGKVYGTSQEGPNPPDRKYNPNCDINDDGFIEVQDYYIICMHYGEADP